jgi:transketolase
MQSSPTSPDATLGYADLPALLALLRSDAKHDPSAASTIDVHWVLYDRILRVTPETASDPERDRLLLSKGHGPASFYAVLAAKGFIPVDALACFGDFDSTLGHHPDAALIAGVEISSGSLGHGLPLAVGTVLGLRAQDLAGARVFVLIGDGELDEGSNHEAIAFAGRAGLDRLTAVIIDNDSSTWGWPGGIETRFTTEGWSAQRVSGRDHDGLAAALSARHAGRPHAVVAVIGTAARPYPSLEPA